jgi:hypothetical protein
MLIFVAMIGQPAKTAGNAAALRTLSLTFIPLPRLATQPAILPKFSRQQL